MGDVEFKGVAKKAKAITPVPGGVGPMTIAMLIVLTGLGTWQVQRLYWKEAVLAQIARAEAAPPARLVVRPAGGPGPGDCGCGP